MRCDKASMRLYAVTDRAWLRGRSLNQMVRDAIAGGATFVQLREKQADHATFVALARELLPICRQAGVPFVIDDDIDVALAVDADGVHVGQKDLEAGRARAQLGAGKILGVSAQSVAQALRAQEAGADYLGVGAVFATSTKQDASEVSHQTLREICAAVDIPVVAIGGINEGNVLQLSGTGVDGVAVVSAIFAADNPRGAAARLAALVQEIV
nr:thiamine phosphate synthase [Maliibacterium massiliense]